VRSGGRVAAAPEPGAGLSARLGSAYAALACGRIDAERLRDLLASHLPDGDPPVFAVDVTTWPRCDAECSRSAATTPILAPSGQPIIAGWAWQWIAQLSFDRDSWTAPVDARRLHPLADTDQTAAAQIHALLARLPAGGAVPLFVFDAGYDSAQLTLELAEAPVAVLVRLRSDRCFYADPPAPHRARLAGRGATAPSSTAPTNHLAGPNCHPGHRRRPVRHRHRGGLGRAASKQQRHPGHGSRGPRPIVRGTILCVQVERVPAKPRPPKVLWLWWAGLASSTWTLSGGPMSAGSTWNTPSASPSSPLAGPRHGRAIPSRPTAGPGWS
jgi:hypothetical protein